MVRLLCRCLWLAPRRCVRPRPARFLLITRPTVFASCRPPPKLSVLSRCLGLALAGGGTKASWADQRDFVNRTFHGENNNLAVSLCQVLSVTDRKSTRLNSSHL